MRGTCLLIFPIQWMVIQAGRLFEGGPYSRIYEMDNLARGTVAGVFLSKLLLKKGKKFKNKCNKSTEINQ